MGARIHDVDKSLKVTVGDSALVTLELTVKVHFSLPHPISLAQEIENATRLLNSEFRHEVAAELENIWRGPAEGRADPEKGAPDLDIDVPSDPSTPPLATTTQAAVSPPHFSPNRRNSQQARTRQQQIVLHLEGRYGFKPDQRTDRLAFTAWLTEVPGLTLTSANDLTPELAAKVLSRLNREPDAAHLVAEWRTYGLGLPVNLSAPEESLGF